LRPLAGRRGDFLHLLASGIRRHHRLDGPDAVDDREHAAADDGPQSNHGVDLISETGGSPLAAPTRPRPPKAGPESSGSARTLPKTGWRRNAAEAAAAANAGFKLAPCTGVNQK